MTTRSTQPVGVLHCDACGYTAESAVELTADLIGTPCPQCGANLLTHDGYDRARALWATVSAIADHLDPERKHIQFPAVGAPPRPGTVRLRSTEEGLHITTPTTESGS
jgi:hypothetical protein